MKEENKIKRYLEIAVQTKQWEWLYENRTAIPKEMLQPYLQYIPVSVLKRVLAGRRRKVRWPITITIRFSEEHIKRLSAYNNRSAVVRKALNDYFSKKDKEVKTNEPKENIQTPSDNSTERDGTGKATEDNKGDRGTQPII